MCIWEGSLSLISNFRRQCKKHPKGNHLVLDKNNLFGLNIELIWHLRHAGKASRAVQFQPKCQSAHTSVGRANAIFCLKEWTAMSYFANLWFNFHFCCQYEKGNMYVEVSARPSLWKHEWLCWSHYKSLPHLRTPGQSHFLNYIQTFCHISL